MMKSKDETPLYHEIPVLAISQAFFACLPQTEKTDYESIEEPKDLSVPFIP